MQLFHKYMNSYQQSLIDKVCIGRKFEPVRVVVDRWEVKEMRGLNNETAKKQKIFNSNYYIPACFPPWL